MELLFMLFVWFMLFIGIPFLLVVFLILLVYVLFSKSAQEKIANFGKSKDSANRIYERSEEKVDPVFTNVRTTSFDAPQGLSKWFYTGDGESVPSSTSSYDKVQAKQAREAKREEKKELKRQANTEKLIKDFVPTLINKSYGVFEVVDVEQEGVSNLNITGRYLSFMGNNGEINNDGANVYYDFMRYYDYLVRVKQTFEKDSLTTGYVVDDMNKDFSKYMKDYVDENAVYIVQQEFQRFAQSKKKEISVGLVNVNIKLDEVEVFKADEFATLKKFVKDREN